MSGVENLNIDILSDKRFLNFGAMYLKKAKVEYGLLFQYSVYN